MRRFLMIALVVSCFSLGHTALGAEGDAEQEIKKLGGRIHRLGPAGFLEVSFYLDGRGLTDRGLRSVGKLDNLISLNLRDTKITSDGLVHLKDLDDLEVLHLERTRVDDSGMKHLRGLKKLAYLNLYATKVSDKSLPHLKRLKKLKRLYVWKTRITAKGAKELQRAIPGLKVVLGVNLSKLPTKPVKKPRKKAVPLKWLVKEKDSPPKSKLGSQVTINFRNDSSKPVKVYWISYGGQRKLYAKLSPGGKKRQNTYSRAIWLITDDQERPLGYFLTSNDEELLAVIPKLK